MIYNNMSKLSGLAVLSHNAHTSDSHILSPAFTHCKPLLSIALNALGSQTRQQYHFKNNLF